MLTILWCRKRLDPSCSCTNRMIGDPLSSTLGLQVLNTQCTDLFFRAPNAWLAGCSRILILGGTRLAEVSESRFSILLQIFISPLLEARGIDIPQQHGNLFEYACSDPVLGHVRYPWTIGPYGCDTADRLHFDRESLKVVHHAPSSHSTLSWYYLVGTGWVGVLFSRSCTVRVLTGSFTRIRTWPMFPCWMVSGPYCEARVACSTSQCASIPRALDLDSATSRT